MHLPDLLKEPDVKIQIHDFLLRPDLTALDLGCADGCYLYMLYHDFNFQRLVGVDKNSIEEIVQNSTSNLKIAKGKDIVMQNNFYDVYLNNITFDDSTLTGRDVHLSEHEFYEIFELKSETYLFPFLFSNKELFDIVILSNVLHLIADERERKAILKYAIESIKEGGLIYLKINHPNNPTAIELNHLKFSDDDFLNFVKDDFEIIYQNLSIPFPNKPDVPMSKLILAKKIR